jgi:hypothetical protein
VAHPDDPEDDDYDDKRKYRKNKHYYSW